MDKKWFLEKIKVENLIPNWRYPGEFEKAEKDEDKLKFLAPASWVYHDSVVKKVLEGDYEGIRPFSAEFVTTLNCTNRCLGPCSYCLQRMCEGIACKNDFSNPKTHMQSLDFAKNLMDKLVEGGIRGITFTGGGEPSLFTQLEDIMEYTSEKGVDMVLYSNGNSWSKERIRRVVQTSPSIIRISLNCGTKNGYNEFHRPFNPGNAFETVLNSISNFAIECKKIHTLVWGLVLL